jgi:HSP20 family protein
MAMVRWEPFRGALSIQERMNRLFDEAFRGAGRGQGDEEFALATWAPPVDIHEEEGGLVLKADLPGVDPKNVDIRVENNVLTLRGERKLDQEVKQDSYHRVERTYGTFIRSFTLPNAVDTESIKAEYKDGVLRVSLPTKAEAKPKQISINVAR